MIRQGKDIKVGDLVRLTDSYPSTVFQVTDMNTSYESPTIILQGSDHNGPFIQRVQPETVVSIAKLPDDQGSLLP